MNGDNIKSCLSSFSQIVYEDLFFLSKLQQEMVCQCACKPAKKVFIHGRKHLIYVTDEYFFFHKFFVCHLFPYYSSYFAISNSFTSGKVFISLILIKRIFFFFKVPYYKKLFIALKIEIMENMLNATLSRLLPYFFCVEQQCSDLLTLST